MLRYFLEWSISTRDKTDVADAYFTSYGLLVAR